MSTKSLTLCHGYSSSVLHVRKSFSGWCIAWPQATENKSLSGLGFADDALMFLKAANDNIATCLTLMGLFSDASDLKLNIETSTLIDVSYGLVNVFIKGQCSDI